MEKQFIDLCTIGNLNTIKTLIAKQYIDIHANEEAGFRMACLKGHYIIVEYLINLYKNDNMYTKINIHANYEEGFISACEKGHLHIVKYLINLDKDYKKIHIESGFRWACIRGHIHIVKYLVNLYKIRQSQNADYCNQGCININLRDEFGYRWLCNHEHTHLVKYFLSIGNNMFNRGCITFFDNDIYNGYCNIFL